MICASCGASEIEARAEGDCPKCKGAVLLDARYRLLSILGRGANGITYRAERGKDSALFAVKEMPLRTMESTKAMELFDREARVLRELDHSAIPKYEDDFVFGEGKSSALYLVQELVEGQSLDEEMTTRRYTEPEVFAIVAELAEVLDYLHRRSPAVVHRDVKPKNVMRRASDKKLVLIDFGSVRDALSIGGGSTVAGTFGYMAPEQLAGKATPASDVYALGALAVALLTRKEPDTLLGDDHTIDIHANLEVSRGAFELIEAMIARDPRDRPRRGRDVIDRARALAQVSRPPAPVKPKAAPAPAPIPKPPNPVAAPSNRSRKERIAEERVQRKLAERERKEEARAAQAERDREEEREKFFEERAKNKPKPKKPETQPVWRSTSDPPKPLNPTQKKWLFGTLGLSAIAAAGIWALVSHRESSKMAGVAATTVGTPEIYARPIAVDVNGDGTEDVIMVSGIDTGVRRDEDGNIEQHSQEHGHWVDFVQAIDGHDGHVLYSIKVGDGFVSGGVNEAKSVRAALIASKTCLGVARLTRSSSVNAELEIYELATGKHVKTVPFTASNGNVCANAKGQFQFHREGGGVTLVDLDKATATRTDASTCTLATANVADVPAPPGGATERITDRTLWPARFSQSLSLRTGGPYKGADVISAGGLGVLIHDRSTPVSREKEPAPTGPTITIDNAVDDVPSGPDNGKIEIVGLDLATNEVRFHEALSSLGFTTQAIDHLEGTPDGALVFFKGMAGLAFIDTTGKKKWALGLPKGHRLSSYTLSRSRAYLHVFGPDQSIYSNLSKKLGSRVLVVDLENGSYLRSLPEGPPGSLDPEPPPPPRPSIDLSKFSPVKGCSCRMMSDGSAVPEKLDWAAMSVDERKKAMLANDIRDAAKKTDGGKEAMARVAQQVIEAKLRGTLLDGGVPTRVDLGMWVKSTVESGGRKRFGVYYSLTVDGLQAFALPHYNERRQHISPPPVLEGDVPLAIACGKGVLVVAHDKTATAWSVAKQDELWTVDLPTSVWGESKTSLGGGATLSCALGKIDKDRVTLPIANVAANAKEKDIALSLVDGVDVSLASSGKDAGSK